MVTFSGVVAGTRYLVVLQADGLRATYGLLSESPLSGGDVVVAGAVVGSSTTGLYFGLRDALDAPSWAWQTGDLILQIHGRADVIRNDLDLVADLDFHRGAGAIIQQLARASRHHSSVGSSWCPADIQARLKPGASVWFCGPAAFGRALHTDLHAHGLAQDRFHQELFEMR